MFRIIFNVISNPIKSFEYVKNNRSRVNYLPSVLFLFCVILVRIFSIYLEHFPLASILPKDASVILEIVKMVLPLLTWTVSCYALTTILNGEAMFKETFLIASYAMVPYIVFTIPLVLISNLMHSGEVSFYNFLHNIIWLWILFLFIIGIKIFNGYTLSQTIGISVLSILVVLLLWITLAFFLSVSVQIYEFIKNILLEMKLIVIDGRGY